LSTILSYIVALLSEEEEEELETEEEKDPDSVSIKETKNIPTKMCIFFAPNKC
jgi:hypothetical protein